MTTTQKDTREKLTKRQKEIVAMCNDGWGIFVGRDNAFLSKGFTQKSIQCALFWKMYGMGIFTQRNGNFYLHEDYENN